MMLFSATLFSNNEYFKDDGDKEDAMNDIAIHVRRCDERILYKNVCRLRHLHKRRFHARERTRIINHHHGRSFDAVKKKLFYESSNSKKGGGFEEEEQEASVRVR
jgi:hypothetical protein